MYISERAAKQDAFLGNASALRKASCYLSIYRLSNISRKQDTPFQSSPPPKRARM